MTKKALDANKLLCDNTVDSSCQSVRFFKTKLDFLNKIFSKKPILFISNKVYKDLKGNTENITNDQKSFRPKRVVWNMRMMKKQPPNY